MAASTSAGASVRREGAPASRASSAGDARARPAHSDGLVHAVPSSTGHQRQPALACPAARWPPRPARRRPPGARRSPRTASAGAGNSARSCPPRAAAWRTPAATRVSASLGIPSAMARRSADRKPDAPDVVGQLVGVAADAGDGGVGALPFVVLVHAGGQAAAAARSPAGTPSPCGCRAACAQASCTARARDPTDAGHLGDARGRGVQDLQRLMP